MTVFDDELKSMMEGEFSEDVTLETPSIDIDTAGIFDETYETIDPDTGAIVMSPNPRVSLFSKEVLAVVAKIEQGWKVVVRGKRYSIKNDPKDDGAGIIILELKSA